MMKFRPSAVPLVTNDPYFSIWSFADRLNDDLTRHWTGRQYPMNIGVAIDGEYFCVVGECYIDSRRKKKAFEKMLKVSLLQYPLIKQRCIEFNKKLMDEARAISEEYA